MQGKKERQEKLFVFYQLSNHVPKDNLYRRLHELLDFNFLYKVTADYYGTTGPKSIDAIVFMKLMLVGYLENTNSDRHIIRLADMRMDIRYFIGYDIDEPMPWHSTLSRTRQLYSADIFTMLFKKVLKQCIDKGMLSGRRQAVDGFFIKANASMDSLVEREILEDAETFRQELTANEEEGQLVALKIEERDFQEVMEIKPKKNFIDVIDGDSEKESINTDQEQPITPSPLDIVARNEREDAGLKPKKSPGNDTHYCPNDPDARMSVKPGKATALNYLGEISVDTASHMITHAQVFTAEKHDSQCLAAVVIHTKSNLLDNDIALLEIIADTGFSSGDALKALEANAITGYIPNRGLFNYERDGFTFYTDGDYYECANGKRLTYRGTQFDGGYFMKRYLINRKECADCPLKEQCSAHRKKLTQIRETIDKPYYDRMHVRMQTRKAKILKKLRQSTVEPVIGTLVNYLGMKRVRTKGLSQANKCLTMAAIAYNLKKMLKHKSRSTQDNLQNLKNDLKVPIKACFAMYLRFASSSCRIFDKLIFCYTENHSSRAGLCNSHFSQRYQHRGKLALAKLLNCTNLKQTKLFIIYFIQSQRRLF
jgi:transposase